MLPAVGATPFLLFARATRSFRTQTKASLFLSSKRLNEIIQILLLTESDCSLAGSERYDDSKAHDKQRMDESKENNKSLMNLKECVRAKAKSAVQEEGFVHIPFRSNNLTLMLKACLHICALSSGGLMADLFFSRYSTLSHVSYRRRLLSRTSRRTSKTPRTALALCHTPRLSRPRRRKFFSLRRMMNQIREPGTTRRPWRGSAQSSRSEPSYTFRRIRRLLRSRFRPRLALAFCQSSSLTLKSCCHPR